MARVICAPSPARTVDCSHDVISNGTVAVCFIVRALYRRAAIVD
jgi:hypothetical protein